jgi:hypothetical protein
MQLLATVIGQDLEEGDDGRLRIARSVARDRVLSTVDPEARHGHKTAARSFDGYKGHVAIDPDSELITATVVTPGNAGDASVAAELIHDLLPSDEAGVVAPTVDGPEPTPAGGREVAVVYGDQAYGSGAFQTLLDDAGIESRCKTQQPTAPGGLFAKDRFQIDLDGDTVTCPAGLTVALRRERDGGGTACFGNTCATCPLQADCTRARGGRTIRVSAYEAALARARSRQTDPAWRDDYRATRPKVERKLAHLMRRKHGGRQARVRGTRRIDGDFRWLAAAVNLARLAMIGLRWTPAGTWAAA